MEMPATKSSKAVRGDHSTPEVGKPLREGDLSGEGVRGKGSIPGRETACAEAQG